MQTADDLETARDLLDHANIEIGIKEDGVWTVFFTRTCGFLDPQSSKCTIHGTERQPRICRDYSAHTCWYRHAFASTLSLQLIRLNAARLDWILAQVEFDETGEIARVPDWDLMLSELSAVPLGMSAVPVRDQNELGAAVSERVPLTGSEQPPANLPQSTAILAFPPGRPAHLSHFDLIRFRLGFPGVSLGVTQNEWYFLVDAPPRRNGKTSPAAHCSKYHLNEESARSMVRVGLEELPRIEVLCATDRSGLITRHPDLAEIRSALSTASCGESRT